MPSGLRVALSALFLLLPARAGTRTPTCSVPEVPRASTLVIENRLVPPYRLVSAVYTLDGATILAGDDEAALAEPGPTSVALGPLTPGTHAVDVTLGYRVDGVGVFAYLAAERFALHAQRAFDVPRDTSVRVRAIVYEHGEGVPEQRVGVQLVVE